MLQIIQDNPNAFVGEQRIDPFAGMQFDQANKFYETQYKLLTSRPMAYKLLDSLKLSEHPDFKVSPEAAQKSTPEKIRSAMAHQIMGSLDVQPVKNTFLVEVSYVSADRELARNIVNAVHREYLQFSMETRQQSFAMIRLWLESELSTLAGKVESSQRRIYDHGRANDYLALEGEDDVVVKKYVELNRLLTTAQAERMAKDAQVQQIQQKGAEAPLVLNNPLVLKLRAGYDQSGSQGLGHKKAFREKLPQTPGRERQPGGVADPSQRRTETHPGRGQSGL